MLIAPGMLTMTRRSDSLAIPFLAAHLLTRSHHAAPVPRSPLRSASSLSALLSNRCMPSALSRSSPHKIVAFTRTPSSVTFSNETDNGVVSYLKAVLVKVAISASDGLNEFARSAKKIPAPMSRDPNTRPKVRRIEPAFRDRAEENGRRSAASWALILEGRRGSRSDASEPKDDLAVALALLRVMVIRQKAMCMG
jgi:hypothetical protein